jgi:hypothetical protein
MRGLLFVLIVVIACLVGLGFYRGWFGVTTEGSGSQHRITLTVDEDKIKADEKSAKDQLPSMGPAATPAEPKKD